MYRVTIQAWMNARTGEYKPRRSYNAELVEVLLENSPQPRDLILKYYGEDAPASVFKPAKHDRLVFFAEDHGYIIIPNVPFNEPMWEKL